jgi:hypothetical protein
VLSGLDDFEMLNVFLFGSLALKHENVESFMMRYEVPIIFIVLWVHLVLFVLMDLELILMRCKMPT